MGGYFLEKNTPGDSQAHALPGLWFNASEIHALLTMQYLLSDLQPGLLDAHILPLKIRLRELLETTEHSADSIEDRIKLTHIGKRKVPASHFEQIAKSLLDRTRLQIIHFNRERNETAAREISPQQLVHYRENWYLDAWCHLREGIRSFSLDAVESVTPLTKPAKRVPSAALAKHFKSGYGIFGGDATQLAKLSFSAQRARWVSSEHWHSNQKGEVQPDGSYLLEIPFSDDRELLMDILRHGDEVEVIAPESLRRRISTILLSAAKKYSEEPFQ